MLNYFELFLCGCFEDYNMHFFKGIPFFLFIYLFIYIYLFLAVLGLRFCTRAFSSCGKRGPLFIAVRGPLTIAATTTNLELRWVLSGPALRRFMGNGPGWLPMRTVLSLGLRKFPHGTSLCGRVSSFKVIFPPGRGPAVTWLLSTQSPSPHALPPGRWLSAKTKHLCVPMQPTLCSSALPDVILGRSPSNSPKFSLRERTWNHSTALFTTLRATLCRLSPATDVLFWCIPWTC